MPEPKRRARSQPREAPARPAPAPVPAPTPTGRPAWNRVEWPGPDFFFGVWGDGAGSIWAVGQAREGRSGITRSRDWGLTWAYEPKPNRSSLHAIHGDGAGALFTVGERGTVLRYDGEAWGRVRAGLGEDTLSAVHCRGEGEVYVGSQAGDLHRSADGGRTWSRVRQGQRKALRSIGGIQGGPLFASGEGRTLLRSDDGLQWTELPVELPPEPYKGHETLERIWISPEGAVVIAAWWRQLLVSEDGGATWQARETPELEVYGTMTGLAPAPGGWLVSALANIFFTPDRGRTWTQEYRHPHEQGHVWTYALWAAPSGHAVAVGTPGHIIRRDP